ncbi:hypothetical protein FOMPIDRAFT_1132494 [Fomitopsis schrenkii]|uniref:F-box domain-containing protein n=1 Tax=Fomitopsis schrenkii TaxID=2126942 RepID=S8DWB0_FOMSC|nr:hypothetical protein FOMPIDRAFT_1132494 [Fomitopsis schrenkii]
MYICPASHSEGDLRVDDHPLAPITTFHYQILDTPEAVGFETETAALAAVLTGLHEGLETLALTSESAPLTTLAQLPQLRWPRLRRLAFYGTPWTEHHSVVAALTTGMQCLRDLSFKLYTTTSQTKIRTHDRLQLSLPLERLVLSEPNPRDAVFEHLPPTLSALSLRNWPHLHFHQYLHDIASDVYDNPRYDILLDSSDGLSVLRRCVGLSLDQLEIEYRADEGEDALLQFMVVNFPHLTSLKLHRYRSALEQREGRDVSAVSHNLPIPPCCTDCYLERHFAELLAPLSQLCRFKGYLDFVDMPRPRVVSLGPRLGFRYEYHPSQIQHCREVTLITATVFAQVLSRAHGAQC